MVSALLAQATCTVNGEPVDCGEAVQAASGFLAGLGIFLMVVLLLLVVNLVFWILSLVHLIKNHDAPNRVLWIILVLLVPFAAIVYYFGPRKAHDKKGHTAQPAAPGATSSPAPEPTASAPVTPTMAESTPPAMPSTPPTPPAEAPAPAMPPTPPAEPSTPPNQPPTNPPVVQ